LNLELQNKGFVVTAASKGLGFSVARELLKEGARVLISSSNRSNLDLALEKLKSEGLTNVASCVANLSLASDIQKLADVSKSELPHIDGLVTNCGGPPAGPPLAISDEQWHMAFDSVFMSVVRLCRHFVPVMVEQGGGSVLAITSTSVKQPIANLTTSNSLRPALVGFLRYLSNEYGDKNVRVNVIAPGRILTDRTLELDNAMAARTGKSLDEVRLLSTMEIPMGRLGDVDEFSGVCAFLMSSRASYITGQTLCVDGGRVQSLF
jgi:3-oxoacyl-[acyl-carrier protein] reductase